MLVPPVLNIPIVRSYVKTVWALAISLGAFSTQAIPVFPTALLDNTTGQSASTYIGAPDDVYHGIGGRVVTFDFGLTPIFNAPGQDFNVYEVDFGSAEFGQVDVLVSNDGVNFYSVKSSESTGLSIPGDSTHAGGVFKKSYNLNVSPLMIARYLRLDGIGTAFPTMISTGFDLDAVGALNTTEVTPKPLSDAGASNALMVVGIAGLGLCRRFCSR
jgi:hypothetical protein